MHGLRAHHGEERCIRGGRGSGTIFFSGCSLRCVFCQDWEISQKGLGREVQAEELAGMMLALLDGVVELSMPGMVRHLVLPADLAYTERVLAFLARAISPRTHVNLMAPYRPCYRAYELPPLDRPLTRAEWRDAVEVARRSGLPLVDGPDGRV